MGAFVRKASVPVGSYLLHAGDEAPRGYLACGGVGNRVLHARLFAVIGTMYGPGDGETTFNLPPNNRYLLPADASIGEQVGSDEHSHTIDGHALDENEIPSHVHPGGGGGGPFSAAGGAFGLQVNVSGALLPDTGAVGGGQPHTHGINNASNIPPSVKTLLCIKY